MRLRRFESSDILQYSRTVRKDNPNIEADIADMVMEKPVRFSVGDRSFCLHWPSLGKSMITGRLLEQAGLSGAGAYSGNAVDTVRMCRDHRDISCRIIAYSTVRTRDEAEDSALIKSRQEYMDKNLSEEDLSSLLSIALSMYDTRRYIKHFGLDKEQTLRERIIKMKRKHSNDVRFGGKTIYGTTIDILCERYGWTVDYVVWGVSLPSIKMLLSDAQTSVYMSKDDRKRIHIPSEEVINADDPANMEKIRRMFKD